jgi:hypothetical protein
LIKIDFEDKVGFFATILNLLNFDQAGKQTQDILGFFLSFSCFNAAL